MARPFSDRNREIAHSWLMEWAGWLSKVSDQSALGARIVNYEMGGSGVPPSSICPEVMRPTRLVRIERAYDDQSPQVQRQIACYYRIIPPDSPLFIKVTPKAREYFLKRITTSLFP